MRGTLFLIILFFITGTTVIGQTKMTQNEINSFKSNVKKQTQQINSAVADFVETKHVSVLKNPSKSSGSMRYKGQKLLWKYDAPKKSVMLFVGDKLTLKNEKERTTNIDLNKNRRFRQLQQLMVGGYTGELFDESAFDIAYYKNGNSRIVVMTPKTKEMARHIKEVSLTFGNNEYMASEIKIVENSDDYSVIELKNKKLNVPINDSEFSL